MSVQGADFTGNNYELNEMELKIEKKLLTSKIYVLKINNYIRCKK